jgi:hypothetical protein
MIRRFALLQFIRQGHRNGAAEVCDDLIAGVNGQREHHPFRIILLIFIRYVRYIHMDAAISLLADTFKGVGIKYQHCAALSPNGQ